MSLSAVPPFHDHDAAHGLIRAETRFMLSEIVRVSQHPDLDLEQATDAVLEVLSTAYTIGFREGQEECCGMGAFPNPFIKEATT